MQRLRFTIVLVGLAATVTACDMSMIPNTSSGSQVQSSAAVSSIALDTIEPGDTVTASSSSVVPQTVLQERILENGTVEFGNADAPVSVLLFTNHSCTYCRQFFQNLVPSIMRPAIDAGRVRLSVIILPLKKHPESELLAAGLLCAAKQQKGHVMHASLMTNTIRDEAALLKEASAIGLKADVFSTCLKDAVTTTAVRQQAAFSHSLNVDVVPMYFISGKKFQGVPQAADLRGALEDGAIQR